MFSPHPCLINLDKAVLSLLKHSDTEHFRQAMHDFLEHSGYVQQSRFSSKIGMCLKPLCWNSALQYFCCRTSLLFGIRLFL